MLKTEHEKSLWGFWGWWLFANTVGIIYLIFALANAFGVTLFMSFLRVVAGGTGIGIFANAFGETLFMIILSIVAGGTGIGVLQWLCLRGQIENERWWVPVTALGWIAALLMIPVLDQLRLRGYPLIILNGATIGSVQWFILRRKVKKSGWWIFANALGIVAAFLFIFLAIDIYILGVDSAVGGLASILTFFIIFGIQRNIIKHQQPDSVRWPLAGMLFLTIFAVGVYMLMTGTDLFDGIQTATTDLSLLLLLVPSAGMLYGAITGSILIWLLQPQEGPTFWGKVTPALGLALVLMWFFHADLVRIMISSGMELQQVEAAYRWAGIYETRSYAFTVTCRQGACTAQNIQCDSYDQFNSEPKNWAAPSSANVSPDVIRNLGDSLSHLTPAFDPITMIEQTDDFPRFHIALVGPGGQRVEITSESNTPNNIPWNFSINGRWYVQKTGEFPAAFFDLVREIPLCFSTGTSVEKAHPEPQYIRPEQDLGYPHPVLETYPYPVSP